MDMGVLEMPRSPDQMQFRVILNTCPFLVGIVRIHSAYSKPRQPGEWVDDVYT